MYKAYVEHTADQGAQDSAAAPAEDGSDRDSADREPGPENAEPSPATHAILTQLTAGESWLKTLLKAIPPIA